MIMAIEARKELAKQSLLLGSHEVELNRIDSAVIAAAKAGSRPPSSKKIFGALADASIVSAEVLDAYQARSIPAGVRIGLSRLHCSMTDLAATLKMYAALSVAREIRTQTRNLCWEDWLGANVSRDPSSS